MAGHAYHKTWDGGDGKYTPGTESLKWNDYKMIYAERRRPGNTFRFRRYRSWFAGGDIGWTVLISNHSATALIGPGIGGINSSFGNWTSAAQLKLLDRLAEKVRGHDFNAGVTAGEMHKTSQMVATNLGSITRALLSVKRGNLAGAARALSVRPRATRLKTTDVSGRWLELQYGWMPLLGSVHEAAKALELHSSGPRKQLVRASYKNPETVEASSSPSYYSLKYTRTTRRSIIYQWEESMSQARQLGLLDPASVAWELTPWSFVVDWFIPIGTYIGLLNFIPHLTGKFLQTTSITARYHTEPTWLGGDKPSGFLFDDVYQTPGVDEFRAFRMKREKLVSPPTVPFPTFSASGAVSGKRFWNAIALAHGRLSKAFGASYGVPLSSQSSIKRRRRR